MLNPLKFYRERRISRHLIVKITVAGLLAATIATALAIPHIVEGHLFNLSEATAQTLILFVDLSIAGLLIVIFRREINREQEEKLLLQQQLNNSFRYIGKANVSLEMIREFSLSLAGVKTIREADKVLQDLLSSIAVGIVQARAARLRIISVPDGRSITEFEWSADPSASIPGISNGWLNGHIESAGLSGTSIVVRSDHEILDQRCIFAADSNEPIGSDPELIRNLLNQFHLLYILSRLIF